MSKAVIILSGGLDSTVCMSAAHHEGYELFPITFFYGQLHSREVEQAKKVADYYNCPRHLVINTDFFREIGASALTSDELTVPTDRNTKQMHNDIPVTYVPFRNAVFLSMAVGYAESLKAEKIYIGVNALDYSGYPDCRPQFIQAFQETVNAGTAISDKGTAIIIATPLLDLTKGGIVKLGLQYSAPLQLTTSCYQGREKACGRCDSCKLRLKGFQEAGIKDPIEYETTTFA